MIVPNQVIVVTPGPQGPTGPTGAGGALGYYGQFISTQDQTNADITGVNIVTMNSTVESNGITIVENSKITFANAGTYLINISLQVIKTDAGDDDFEVWFSKNGTDFANSSTLFSLHGNAAKVVANVPIIETVAANDYIQIEWFSADADMSLEYRAAGTSPTRPAVPSAIVTVSQIMYLQTGS